MDVMKLKEVKKLPDCIDGNKELVWKVQHDKWFKELMKKVECLLVMPWEGTMIECSLTAEEIHRKITDDLRKNFNMIIRDNS